MDKLSIEEKAKAYDKALSVALETYQTQPMYMDWLEKMFPQLAESEDERIRKEIIAFLIYYHTGQGNSIKYDDSWIAWLEKQGAYAISWNENTDDNKPQKNHSVLIKTTHGNAEGEWNGKEWIQYRWSCKIKDSDVLYWMNLSELEKQGEQANFLNKIQIGDKVIRNKDGVLVNLSQLNRVAKKNEKQGEQKPYGQRQECVDCQFNYAGECKGSCAMKRGEQRPVVPKFKVGDVIRNKWSNHTKKIVRIADDNSFYILDDGMPGDYIAPISDQENWVLVEQNPAWSEEDEEMLNSIIEDFGDGKTSNMLQEYWLKSLKDRVQPKQEWSEEDKRKLRKIFATFELYKGLLPSSDSEYIDRCLSWLKSLRPQNTITDEELTQAKKDAYNNILDKIEYHSDTPTFDDGWSAAIWYLKKRNAQPQNRWKPSKEQMDALQYVYRSCNPLPSDKLGWDSIKTLELMYQELKKLREE